MSSSKKTKKLALFERGAEAAHRYAGSSESYFCPICGSGFNRSALLTGELTLDEAPPASVGGKGIVLTCKGCNNQAGNTTDRAVACRAKLLDFKKVVVEGASGLAGNATLSIGGESVNVTVKGDVEGALRFESSPGRNDPNAAKRTIAYLERLAHDGTWKGEEFTITARMRYHSRLAMVGDLKAAFLVAFAALGYRYAFDPLLDKIRQQIRNPNDHVIDNWTMTIKGTGGVRPVMVVAESLPGVVVQLDEVGIILPWFTSPKDFYSELPPRYGSNKQMQLKGKRVPWPTRLEMVLDFWHSPR
jgi:hypothetical protein